MSYLTSEEDKARFRAVNEELKKKQKRKKRMRTIRNVLGMFLLGIFLGWLITLLVPILVSAVPYGPMLLAP